MGDEPQLPRTASTFVDILLELDTPLPCVTTDEECDLRAHAGLVEEPLLALHSTEQLTQNECWYDQECYAF